MKAVAFQKSCVSLFGLATVVATLFCQYTGHRLVNKQQPMIIIDTEDTKRKWKWWDSARHRQVHLAGRRTHANTTAAVSLRREKKKMMMFLGTETLVTQLVYYHNMLS